jgi:putative flippase GtrA
LRPGPLKELPVQELLERSLKVYRGSDRLPAMNLFQRYRRSRMSGEILRFIATGTANTAITYIVYVLSLQLVPYGFAYTAAFICGLVFQTVQNTSFVFGYKISLCNVLAYGTYYTVYFALNLTLIPAVVMTVGTPLSIAPLLLLPAMTPLHFIASRFLLKRVSITPTYSGSRSGGITHRKDTEGTENVSESSAGIKAFSFIK